ncbi:MAG: hypothetical protein H7242_12965 [Microbacteriaceae bacterium]|nr:hypothetical protein [Burkholderiaceae bacterium]
MSSLTAHSKLYDWQLRHGIPCFALMTLAFVVFGLLSLDLVKLVLANAGFLWHAGWHGLMAGGFAQLLELGLSAAAAIASYLVFKLCEHVMVDRLAHK